MSDMAEIVKGEDRVLVLSVKQTRKDGDPYDLTGWTKIAVEFRKADGEILQKTTDPVGGVASTNTHDGVIFTATKVGTLGNSISLIFNGTDDIATVIDTWNLANPSNTVSHNGSGTAVLTATTLGLSGGVDAQTYVTIAGDALLGKVQVELTDVDTNALRLGKSQSIRMKIDKSDQRRIAIFRNSYDVVNPQF